MFNRPSPKTSLNLEALEVREVPAIVLAGTQATTGPLPRPVTPDGGAVTIREVVFSPTDIVLTTQPVGGGFALANAATRNKSATANDTITLTNSGDTLTISASDGIFVRYTNNNGTFFQFRGNTLDVKGVTGLTVDLQLGGNDNVTDNTTGAAMINGGDGDDQITVSGGGAVNPLLLQLLTAPGGLNPALLPLLGGMGGATKTLNGGGGGDTLTANGFASNMTLDGGVGNDMINGPQFGFLNTLKGGDDNDTIIGGLGLDIIDGGAGFDILFGQAGGDIYLAADGGPDFVLEQPGDIALTDSIDF